MTDEVLNIPEELGFWRELIENWWIDHTGQVPETVWEALAQAEQKYRQLDLIDLADV